MRRLSTAFMIVGSLEIVMENSEILKLPYILPSQAQKHVTHNEAIRQLDALVQLSVVSMDVSEPPDEPAAGSRFIVGENASGEWAGLEGQVVAYLDGAWTTFEPVEGWLAYVEDQGIVVVRKASAWQDFPSPKTLENMDGVGVGAQPDATNKLSIASDAALFSHSGNSHRLKINKAEESQTASLVFQSDWMGHAEFGLTGSNDFQVKVSDNGTTFQTAMQIDKSTGQVEFPLGTKATAHVLFQGRWYAEPGNPWTTFSTNQGPGNENFQTDSGTDAEPTFDWNHIGSIVRAGSRIKKILAFFRANNSELQGLNIRLVFKHAQGEQILTNDNANYETIYQRNNLEVVANGFATLEDEISEYTCPQNGFLLMYVQPIGSFTTTRYAYSSTSIEIISA